MVAQLVVQEGGEAVQVVRELQEEQVEALVQAVQNCMQGLHILGEPEHQKAGSTIQASEQPSPLTKLLSSHC